MRGRDLHRVRTQMGIGDLAVPTTAPGPRTLPLTGAIKPSTRPTRAYEYNGEGLRVAKTVGGGTTRYVWDPVAGLPGILAEGTSAEYVYGHDLIGRIVTMGRGRRCMRTPTC
jgi:YD repeat-containing protein